jgi:glycosyltransferase involved in cell wall biosynthesis
MLGSGILKKYIKELIEKEELYDEIEVKGAVSPSKVRKYMEKSNIFLFTSDKDEGWGAVLNEAMNSGCTVIANKDIGAVPFLADNNKNAFVYNSGDFEEMYNCIKKAIEDKELRYNIGKNAYNTIIDVWNAENATKNLLDLINNILNGKQKFLKHGPASKIT